MSPTPLPMSESAHKLTWEDIAAVIFTLGLAAAFIGYQLPSSPEPANNLQDSASIKPPATHQSNAAENYGWTVEEVAKTPETSSSAAHWESDDHPPQRKVPASNTSPAFVDNTSATATQGSKPNGAQPIIQMDASFPSPQDDTTNKSTVNRPALPTGAFTLERNIQSNLIDFSGRVSPNARLQLKIEGTPTPMIVANERGQWKHSQMMQPGFYSIELSIFNDKGDVTETYSPATYQILPRNQSSGALKP